MNKPCWWRQLLSFGVVEDVCWGQKSGGAGEDSLSLADKLSWSPEDELSLKSWSSLEVMGEKLFQDESDSLSLSLEEPSDWVLLSMQAYQLLLAILASFHSFTLTLYPLPTFSNRWIRDKWDSVTFNLCSHWYTYGNNITIYLVTCNIMYLVTCTVLHTCKCYAMRKGEEYHFHTCFELWPA